MKVFDCFMYSGEADILECRLRELWHSVDAFILVESAETHLRPGEKRPSLYLEEKRRRPDRFAELGKKVLHVWVPKLEASEPMHREHEHREWMRTGLEIAGARPDDFVIQSDADEIVSARGLWQAMARLNASGARQLISFSQSLHSFAVDWAYPVPSEMKPAITRFRDIRTFTGMRFDSKTALTVPHGGWHFTWMGTPEEHCRKLDSIYEGGEIAHVRAKLAAGYFREHGIHVDGVQMAPIEVTSDFPAYVRNRWCPPHWFRPRSSP